MNIDRLAEALSANGIGAKTSRVLAFLMKNGESSSYVIEKGAGLRQPVVSTSTAWLLAQGWVTVKTEKASGKGRPRHLYTMVVEPSDLVDQIEIGVQSELGRIRDNLLALREELP